MESAQRLKNIENEYTNEWENITEEIREIKNDLSMELDGQRRVVLGRKVKHLEIKRERVEKQLERIQSGNYRFSEEIINESLAEIKERMADESRDRLLSRKRIINHRQPLVLLNFKDRTQEIQSFYQHLLTKGVCLISVVGREGMGKTALTSKILSELENGYVVYDNSKIDIDGIIYLSSDKITIEKIYAGISQLLTSEDRDDLQNYWTLVDVTLEDKIRYLLSKIESGFYLLVFDNFETQFDKHGFIKDAGIEKFLNVALVSEHGAHIIVTSRENIQLSQVLSQRARMITLDNGLPEQLAIDYLRELDSFGDVGLRDANQDELHEIVKKVYGIPKALELVATILASDFSLSIRDLIQDRRLFSGKIIDNLVEKSYELLLQNEKSTLEVVCTYLQPIEFTAIAFILNSLYPDVDVNEILKSLIRKHFISFDRIKRTYGVIPLIRGFVKDKMSSDNQNKYETLAASFYSKIQRPKQEWRDIDDLEPALFEFEHLVNASNFTQAYNLLEEIEEDYLRRWGYYVLVKEMRHKLQGHLQDVNSQCVNSTKLGRLFGQTGDTDIAFEYLQNALQIAEKSRDKKLLGTVLSDVGMAYFSLSRFDEAMDYYKRALEIVTELGDTKAEVHLLGCLGNGYRRFGDIELTRKCFFDALKISRGNNDLKGEARILFDIGISYYYEGQYEKAIDSYEDALQISRRIRHKGLESYALGNIGEANLSLGNLIAALDYFELALDKTRQTGSKRSEARNLARIAHTYFVMNKYEDAITNYSQAIELAHKTKDFDGECIWQVCLGVSQICLGEMSLAKQELSEAIRFSETLISKSPRSHNLTRFYLGVAVAAYNFQILENVTEDVLNRVKKEYMTVKEFDSTAVIPSQITEIFMVLNKLSGKYEKVLVFLESLKINKKETR